MTVNVLVLMVFLPCRVLVFLSVVLVLVGYLNRLNRLLHKVVQQMDAFQQHLRQQSLY
jgi:hypothetical protein